MIDASVARASGGEGAAHPTAAATRDFLQAVLTICHKAVMTPAVRDEWDKHQSNFARKWRSSMVARKKLKLLNLEEREDLRHQIELENIPRMQKNAMLKDCHLIEAAIMTGRSIIALDIAARNLFGEASENILEIQNILWINPTTDQEHVMAWLEGAADQADWQLGHNFTDR